MKGILFLNKRYIKGVLFLLKWYIKLSTRRGGGVAGAGGFEYILSLFGPFSVDRFASPDSAKCAMSR